MPAITLNPVMTRATKRTPSAPTAYIANIVTGKSIEVVHQDRPAKSFVMGDMAEYDSYNLSYYGPITKITAKTITITERHGGEPRVHRLPIERFCWRNHNFNLATTQEDNALTSWSI